MQAAAAQSFKSNEDRLQRAYTFADLSNYSWKQRLAIRAADVVFYLLNRLIGRTIRWEVEGQENWEAASTDEKIPILTFWHTHIFAGTYFFQRRRIVVMTSQSFDGEYIARFIQRFGYGAVRGSSTRGGVGAIVEMVRLMRAGCPTAFTVDGPKGPRNVAKMGAVLLAKKTGHPILPFTVTSRSFWTIHKSWDQTQIPKPFTRVRVELAPPIYVPADADEVVLETKREELQKSLDQLNKRGEQWRCKELGTSC
jgi:lysophospholipid acyltransferase (LPLAT)-like uncharacterized protein